MSAIVRKKSKKSKHHSNVLTQIARQGAAASSGGGGRRHSQPSSRSSTPEVHKHIAAAEPPRRKRQHAAQRRELPIYPQRQELIDAVRQNRCVVIVGETGSGKTTQLPQFLLEAGLCKGGKRIGVTQPRRVAAISLAERVAEETGSELGAEVGYSVRFDDKSGPHTKLKFLTDGMLLREAIGDGELSKYSVIVLDEAHERSVHTDVLLGLLREMLRRPGSTLKLVVMSATLDAELFVRFLGAEQTALKHVAGRQHPVDMYYTPEAVGDYIEGAMVTALQLHAEEPLGGDVLVFLTGQDEIESLQRLLEEKAKALPHGAPPLIVRTIFAALASEQQMKVFEATPAGSRKVILATNIAETSITIPGVKYVVDPGVVKMRAVHPRTGTETLWVEPVSQPQAWQRAGRAGRLGPGKCYRLYTEDSFLKLRKATTPLLHRCNLAAVALQLKNLGISDVLRFPFPQAPAPAAMQRALETLLALGAISAKRGGTLTDLGRRMGALPLEPMLAKLLLTAPEFGCVAEMLSLVAMLAATAESPLFATPREQAAREAAVAAQARLRAADGDHLTLLRVYERADAFKGQERINWCRENFVTYRTLRKADDIRKQLRELLARRMGLDLTSCGADDSDSVRRCLVKACFLNVAIFQPSQSTGRGEYKTVRTGQVVHIHPTSALFGRSSKTTRCVIYHEMVATAKLYMRTLTVVDEAWLCELVPQFFLQTGEE